MKEYTVNTYSVKAYLDNNCNKNRGQDLKTMTEKIHEPGS